MSPRRDAHTTQRARGPAHKPAAHGAVLVVISGPNLGQWLAVHDVPTVIGRSQGADFQVDHKSVSRQHCTVWQADGRYYVRDLGSTNRTNLRERPIEQAEMQDGDLLTIGDVVLKLVLRDSHEARYHEALYQLATVDSLTGLLNRRMFREQLETALLDARTSGLPLSLAFVDLDHFKAINDRYGHLVGDEVLRGAAQAVARELSDGAIAGRLGGEEFAVLLPNTDLAAALQRAESMRQAIFAARCERGAADPRVSASIGVAQYQPPQQTGTELMREADAQLFRAKAAGRNRVCAAPR